MNAHAITALAASVSSCVVTALVGARPLSLAALVVAVFLFALWLRRVLHEARYSLDQPLPAVRICRSGNPPHASQADDDARSADFATSPTIRIPFPQVSR